jgi:hypothetical protein
MAHSTYPTDAEVLAVCLSVPDFPTITESDVSSRNSSAIEQFKREVGWQPFLSTGATESITFDVNGRKRVSPPFAMISTSSIQQVVGGTVVGTISSDMWRMVNPANPLGSYMALEFDIPVDRVVWTGVRGLCTSIPDDVWDAVRSLAVGLCADAFRSFLGDIVKEKQGNVLYEYNKESPFNATALREDRYNDVIKRYKRKVVF